MLLRVRPFWWSRFVGTSASAPLASLSSASASASGAAAPGKVHPSHGAGVAREKNNEKGKTTTPSLHHASAWFRPAGGLHFECSQCGSCCKGGTKVSPGEIEELIEHLNKDSSSSSAAGFNNGAAAETTHGKLLDAEVI